MRKAILPLVAFLLGTGCAGRAYSPPHRTPLAHSSRVASEEFDPQSLHEDLLLIQPVFSLSISSEKAQGLSGVEKAKIDSPEGAAPPRDASGEAELRTVYRVQVMALRNGDVARQRRADLERRLGVPVRVDLEHGLFVVRAGACATEKEAEQLRGRISRMDPDYTEAYVVAGRSAGEVLSESRGAESENGSGEAVERESALSSVDTVSPPPVLVPVFGWRILLDQFLSHGEAERLRRDAAARLKRTDIDVTFKAPWYKVELGNFRTEAKAQEFLERVKRRYPNALAVRGQIFVPAEE